VDENLKNSLIKTYDFQLAYYGSVNFIFQYTAEAIVPLLFKKGIKSFKKVITNIEDKRYATINNDKNGNSNFNESFPSIKFEVTQNFDLLGQRANMNNIATMGSTFYNRLSTDLVLFADDNIVMLVGKNIFRYSFSITIKDESYQKISVFASNIYNNIFVEKPFYINTMDLKFRLDPSIITILKDLYKDEYPTEEEFLSFLETNSGNKIIKQLDLATGNEYYFSLIKISPLCRVSGLTINNNNADTRQTSSLNFTVELEVQLPNNIFIESYLDLAQIDYIDYNLSVLNENPLILSKNMPDNIPDTVNTNNKPFEKIYTKNYSLALTQELTELDLDDDILMTYFNNTKKEVKFVVLRNNIEMKMDDYTIEKDAISGVLKLKFNLLQIGALFSVVLYARDL